MKSIKSKILCKPTKILIHLVRVITHQIKNNHTGKIKVLRYPNNPSFIPTQKSKTVVKNIQMNLGR
ncbi:MAG: hypothetical protein NC824_04050 [Candidatus Omnitrophica bacterium]|nr:hypothetical protein [Candidatus Omnitrophota bacterium]